MLPLTGFLISLLFAVLRQAGAQNPVTGSSITDGASRRAQNQSCCRELDMIMLWVMMQRLA